MEFKLRATVKQSISLLQFVVFFALLLIAACDTETKPAKPPVKPKGQTKTINVPNFNADSAYDFVKKQVDFGPRVPGTAEHKACAEWMEVELKKSCDKALTQSAFVTVPTGKQVPMYNVIGSFKPEAKRRLLLSAHWDTRPFADQDDERVNEPIDGANDGASGVGVLLEIARLLKEQPLKHLGVDIIFWDVEDSGTSAAGAESYCLGSQHWGREPHVPFYTAQHGINLDMVGAKDAVFYQEGHSLQFAPHVVKRMWEAAHTAGYSSRFPYQSTGPVTDDHLFVNILRRVPMIDIIEYDTKRPNAFGDYWHTHDDNMSVISKETLKAVGQSVSQFVYELDAG